MMTPDQYAQALDSLEGYFGVVGMFGGDPCMHPQFDKLCEILRGKIPWEQRGLWSNDPVGKGTICRITFSPHVSNLNVHLSQKAYDEFARDWPECRSELKGLTDDSRHAPPFVAMQDVIDSEEERWELISNCDVNQYWSAMICVVRGELRGFFCELAGAMAMLHENDPKWPDLGVPVVKGWWNQGMDAFKEQVGFYCHKCGIPMKAYGELAINGNVEQVSATHADVYKPKTKGRELQLVTLRSELNNKPVPRATDYIENSKR